MGSLPATPPGKPVSVLTANLTEYALISYMSYGRQVTTYILITLELYL